MKNQTRKIEWKAQFYDGIYKEWIFAVKWRLPFLGSKIFRLSSDLRFAANLAAVDHQVGSNSAGTRYRPEKLGK